MARLFTARWVLPIERPPIEGGWLEVDGGRISRVGRGAPPGSATDLGDVAVLPGLVNAHAHLELSWMAGRVEPAASMSAWIRALLALRRDGPAGGRDEEVAAAGETAAAMRASGTVLVGDISNALFTPKVLANAGLGGVVFHELLGFNHPDPEGEVRRAWDRIAVERPLASLDPPVVCAVAAHAPYSVSPALFRAIAGRGDATPLSIHLAESVDELEFLGTGGGPMRDLLRDLGVSTEGWEPPGRNPVQYISDLGYLRPGTLVVHGVHLSEDDLEHLRRKQAVLVTCPRSNLWVGAGSPKVARFFAAGLSVAVGTDSLASVGSVNMFDELAELRRLAPEVSGSTLLESATLVGARALGFGRDYGTIAPGKRAALVSVAVPPAEIDVEEYLVSGVPPAAVTPLPL